MSQDLLARFVDLRADLNANLLDREDVINAALVALLSREHLLLLGPPGTAKSLLARELCARISGAQLFERLLTRFSTPEELFGPLSLAALERDRYERVTQGTLVEAHLGFVDEVFKANSAILNSLLTLINERIFHNGTQVQPVPLLSLIGASNELPEEAGLTAVFDRFLFRVVVEPLAGDDSLRALLDLSPCAAAHVSLDDIQAAQDAARQIPLSEESREAIITIRNSLAEEGVPVSDRRLVACAYAVRTKAWLVGDTATTAEHADILVHALWQEPGQQRLVERVVSKVASPLDFEAVELEDAAKDLYDQRPAPDNPHLAQALEPILRQLDDIHTRLDLKQAPFGR